MTTRLQDSGDRLVDNPNINALPSDQFPRRDPRAEDPRDVPELRWRGTQQWICSVVAAWEAADGWYVIDWGDGTSDMCHPDLRIARHSYTRNSICDNLQHTAVARPLYRDWTTGPVVARSVLQARGWGSPGHTFRVFSSTPNHVSADLFRQEPPLGYGVVWEPDTTITQLPDGESRAEHTYDPGPARTPLIGVLDRPARRLRWFDGPQINTKRINGGSMLIAEYTITGTQWDGYTAEYTVTNNTKTAVPSWVLEFQVDKPAQLADAWGAASIAPAGESTTARTYRATSKSTLQGGQAATFTIRMEPGRSKGGEANPLLEPHDCTINGEPCQGKQDPDPPTAPTDLKVTAAGHKTLSIEWKPSTDNVGVASYELDIKPAPATGKPDPVSGNRTATTIGGLAAKTEYTVALRAYDFAGNRSEWSQSVKGSTIDAPEPAAGWGVPHAPYVDLAGWPTPQLDTYSKESGSDGFTLAFIQAGGPNDSMPSWGGYKHAYGITHNYNAQTGKYEPITSPFEHANITGFAAQHHVVISFGGANGFEISQAAKDVEEAYERYKSVIDAYQPVTHYDFDIEGAAEHDAAANERRAAALAKLQRENKELKFALTLPVNPTGLTNSGIGVLQAMVDGGVSLSLVNIMAMEFGTAYPGDMGELTIQACESTVKQIAPILDVPEADAYKLLGCCPMLGKNNNSRIWTLDHAKKLLDYANSKQLGSLTHWEATRDRNACFGETYRCTGVAQAKWEYTQKYFAPYTGGSTATGKHKDDPAAKKQQRGKA